MLQKVKPNGAYGGSASTLPGIACSNGYPDSCYRHNILPGLIDQPNPGQKSTVQSPALSQNGKFIASNQFLGDVALLNLESASVTKLSPISTTGYTHLQFNSISTKLLAGDSRGNLLQWNTETYDVTFQRIVSGGGIRALAQCPDDSCIAVIALNGGIFMYDGKGNFVRELNFKNRPGKSPWSSQTGNPWAIAISPDGGMIAVGSVNGEVVVWDVSSGKLLHYWVGHLQEQVVTLVFSPDGRYVASASFDGTIKVWLVT